MIIREELPEGWAGPSGKGTEDGKKESEGRKHDLPNTPEAQESTSCGRRTRSGRLIKRLKRYLSILYFYFVLIASY